MTKLFLIIVFVLALLAFIAFKVLGNSSLCPNYQEPECKTKLACKPFYEYGISCGEDGCTEGERFKECRSRF